ncbi:glycogen debranching N-terminal domain-containing protein [Pseudactinotalea suaedae]|uniref:glycogen debranching N-terminal domain-containing protein n=1 Tax=Pseudactinotalea suaedae TaxID=1524924 RepID=UPI0012E27E32|nr:glycogen debranching N-terminal domain-containing protein [Pseudactinotalea suaedae]
MERQPLLHDRLVCLAAPTQAWSGPDGQIRGTAGIDGVYHADVRVLSSAVLQVDGVEPEPISAATSGAGSVLVSAVARSLDDPGADPTVRVDRWREVSPGGFGERFVVSCATAEAVTARVRVRVAADLAGMDDVKAGRTVPAAPARSAGVSELSWQADAVTALLNAPGAVLDLTDPTSPVLAWEVTARPDEPAAVGYELTASDAGAVVRAASGPAWATPTVSGLDDRLAMLLTQSLEDLSGLVMSASTTPQERFVAAGAPWFFTLFGRDSLWTARMMLPLGTDLAAGTLRTLAALQGEREDPETAEQPGKIVHEVRRAAIDLDDGTRLPPRYYGTIDATPLWVCVLHDAWRWGMPATEVEALLPHAERALAWMADHADPDGDGFLEYVDASGRGLANQGWKDSGDSIRWRDGSLAEGTIALCEVQAYAHEAARAGADLLEAFGRPGATRWRDWAAAMRTRFREQFWVEDAEGPYPAIALDGEKRAVDALTSNIGHLLGTGLLDPDEERLVADRLTSTRLSSGFGVHTLAHGSGGFWPLRYHGGTVWPHDTAIAITGLARAGLPEHARDLAEQLLTAAPSFGYRLPELFSGDRAEDVRRPAPYPAACRPQAWTAASAVALLGVALGLRPDVPAGTLRVTPTVAGPFDVSGLRLGPDPLDVAMTRDGELSVATSASVAVEIS